MSDSEDENFCFFGKPLEQYDEDAFPKKKPISVEEQIATDAEGRRRFHGAFTGGFSAGFYNTVGSLEGWTPNEFKSTRQEKAQNFTQRPEDFMDEEDKGEFGIAPQTVKATKEFSTAKKRKRQGFSEGPIPGEPVLETLLTSGNETVGYMLLKNLGIEDKLAEQKEIMEPETKVYGCQMPTQYKISENIENKQYKIPYIYKEFLSNPKSNTFGLGYQGLDKSHINLFHSTNLVMKDKNNKKVSIRGQAFGVGAFEDEDEDIYVREDMSNYDFELTKEKASINKRPEANKDLLFGVFKASTTPLVFKKSYPPPTIPHSFTGVHKVRKSRFEPVEEEPPPVDRRDINPAIRARYLGEDSNKPFTQSKPTFESESSKTTEESNLKKEDVGHSVPKKEFDISSIFISDKFVAASQNEDVGNILEEVKKSETIHGTEQLRDAARMQMFGLLTRITTDWHPCSVLCKRFNVPEPLLDRPEDKKKRTKNLIFEYQKHVEVTEASLKPGLSTNLKEEIPGTPNSLPESTSIPNPEESSIEDLTGLLGETVERQSTSIEEENSEVEPLPKDITEKIDVAEKQDLFKAVFLSSSESEDEEDVKEEKEDDTRTEELKTNVLSDQLLPKIKPIKEGILSNVNFSNLFKPKPIEDQSTSGNEDSTLEKPSTESNAMNLNCYGPKLPSDKMDMISSKITVVFSDNEDDWVEKSTDKKKKAKHKKKHKKEKHKKKKHAKKKSRG